MASTANADSILLGGYDGTQKQTTIEPAATVSAPGVRQLTGAKQDTLAVGAVTTRIWTDQATNKDFQWNTTGGSTEGLWVTPAFTPAASTTDTKWVISQAAASWINFETTNTGTGDVTLDQFLVSARRLTGTAAPTGSPDTLTISLMDNRIFTNPTVFDSASALTSTGTQTITLSGGTA